MNMLPFSEIIFLIGIALVFFCAEALVIEYHLQE